LEDWIAEKMLAAQDETYRDAKNAHSKWMRHQVWMHYIITGIPMTTPAENAMSLPLFVCLFVCCFICLSAGLLRN